MNQKILSLKQVFLILFFLGFLIFSRSLFNGFVWDDALLVEKNPYLSVPNNCPKFFTGLGMGYFSFYRPIQMCYLSIVSLVSDGSTFPFHLIQLLIHIANSWLVYIIFTRHFKPGLSLLLTVIFLIHPIQVESVSYISASQEALYLFFGLSGYLLLNRQISINKRVDSFLSLIFFTSSLFSKESGILFVALSTIYYKRLKPKKLIAIPFLSLLINVLARIFFAPNFAYQSTGVSISELSFFHRLISIPKITTYYLKTFFFPVDLAISQQWVVKSAEVFSFFIPILVLLVIVLINVRYLLLLKKKNLPQYQSLKFFIIWFLLGLSLHIQLIPLDMTVADRWFYFGSIGLIGYTGVLLTEIEKKVGFRYIIIVLALSISILSARTLIRLSDWKDKLTLYKQDVVHSEYSWDLHSNLGIELIKNGKINEAFFYLKKSVELAPNHWRNKNNLGIYYLLSNQIDLAEKMFTAAISINPNFIEAYENYASLLSNHKYNKDESVKFIESSVKLFPQNEKLWFFLSLIYWRNGMLEDARQAGHVAAQISQDYNIDNYYFRISHDLPIDLK